MFARIAKTIAVGATSLALLGCSTTGDIAAGPQGGVILIAGADVLPMTDAGLLEDRTLVIEGDRIAAIRPYRESDLRLSGAIDARGKVAMPGLVDMHVHFAKASGGDGDPAQRAAAVMLAHGVTTARSMAGSAEHIALRAAVEDGTIPGPRIYAGSPAVSDATVKSPAEARAAIASAKAASFDFIKSHFISDLATWQAAKDEADRLGLATAGHVANAVKLERAINAGQQIEHLDGFVQATLPEDAPERNVEFGQIPPPPILAKIDLATLADKPVFDLAAAERSWQVPTLSLFELLMDTSTSIETLKALPEMRYVPDEAIEQWSAQRQQLAGQLTPEYAGDVIAFRRAVVAALDAHGVPLMAGSDTAQAFHVWGPALHREIETLAAIIGPHKALQAATVTPRDYFRSLPKNGSALGWDADFGTIEQGARADLILLDKDPRADLSALHRPNAVIKAGRLYDRAELDAMLDQAAADAKGTGPIAAATAPPVWVVRHMEAEDHGERMLTVTGRQQAEVLARDLSDKGIGAIYVTDTLRARQTAEPLAMALGVEPQAYAPLDVAALKQRIAEGGVPALVVGHSNTAPAIAQAFGADPATAEELVEFGKLYASTDASIAASNGRVPAALATPCDQAGLPADAQCGTLRVAEDRSKPNGRTIPVRFAVLPATGAATQDPLVVIPGGPGLGAVQAGAGINQLFGAFRSDRDLVLIDQRGTGGSNRLACEDGINASTLLAALEPMDEAAVVRCRDALMARADLGQYHTREAVRDMEAVRLALGYERFDLFGMSYGTRPALDYLRLYPERVGETVIRAAAPVGMNLPFHTARDAQAVYDLLVATCNAQPDCAERHPDLAQNLDRMMGQFDAGPVMISVTDPRNGERVQTELTKDAFRSVLFFMLYIPEFTTQLPPLIDMAAEGTFSPMVQAVSPALVGIVGEVAWGLRWSVICDEDVRQIDASAIDAAVGTAFMGRSAIDEDRKACALWPAAEIPADYRASLDTDKPVLVISGAHDPIAGPVWGESLVQGLANARHINVSNAAHLPALPGCTASEVRKFFDGAPLTSLDSECEANRSPLKLAVAAPLAAPAAQAATADADADPALWRVADEDTTIYLFGTFHLLDKQTDWFNDEVLTAFEASDSLVVEAEPPTDMAAVQQLVMRYAVDQSGTPLSAKVSPETAAALQETLAEAGLPANAFDSFDPWFASMSLSSIVMQKLQLDGELGPESVLSKAARASGKPIAELEGFEYQLQLFDDMPPELQEAFLASSLDQFDTMIAAMEDMKGAWARGDVEALAELMNESIRETPELYRLVFSARNANWTEWIVERLEQPGTVFMAVGAGHLSGPQSVPELLAKRGLKTSRVAAE